jgi:cytochrome b
MKNPDAQHPTKTLRVWDPLVRIFHWSLVISFTVAWFSSSSRDDFHQWIGFIAAGLISIRLIWGFIGTPYARFTQFVRSPRQVLGYLFAILKGTEARYVGHNPAGGMMVLALLTGIAATAFTGWLMTTDTYYGDETMQGIHSLCANGVVVLIIAHLGGVVLASRRHKENLVTAMLTGNKRTTADDDVV